MVPGLPKTWLTPSFDSLTEEDLRACDTILDRLGQFAQVHPETHVLLLTEYAAESEFVRSGLEDTGYSFLAQPFTGEALAQRAEDLLCAPSKRAARPTEPHDEQSNGAEVSFGHGYLSHQHTDSWIRL